MEVIYWDYYWLLLAALWTSSLVYIALGIVGPIRFGLDCDANKMLHRLLRIIYLLALVSLTGSLLYFSAGM